MIAYLEQLYIRRNQEALDEENAFRSSEDALSRAIKGRLQKLDAGRGIVPDFRLEEVDG